MELVSGIASFSEREKCMAHNLLQVVATNPGQESFILACGRDHMLPVTKQVSDFLTNPSSFLSYKRPPQAFTEESLGTDEWIKDELIKSFALGQTIYEKDFTEVTLPFPHHKVHDAAKLAQADRDI